MVSLAPVVDRAEDTAEASTEEGGEEPPPAPFNGVAFGVLPGVAWRSRMLISNARSFVAASRMEITPIDIVSVTDYTYRERGRKGQREKSKRATKREK